MSAMVSRMNVPCTGSNGMSLANSMCSAPKNW
jgi:hypothetical protein